jgi:hypothetical protein
MTSDTIASLPLHDAVLQSVELLWRERLLRVRLTAFVQTGQAAEPRVLEFQDVSAFDTSRVDAWGPSEAVLSATSEGGVFRLQMQSGDVVTVKAGGYRFEAAL